MMVVESLNRTEIVDDVTCKYEYRLIKAEVSLVISDDKIVVQAYGVEVERKDYMNGAVFNIERDSIRNISPQRHKVHNLLRMLHDNLVSPIHLIEVLGEYVDEYIIDFDGKLSEVATNAIY